MADIVIPTPLDDYELLDFGAGRRLERFGAVVVERPDAFAVGAPAHGDWTPDWRFDPRSGPHGRWLGGMQPCAEAWRIHVDGQPFSLSLGEGPELGCRPEQLACWRWVRERLRIEGRGVRVLNLFAGPGGTTAAALASGAYVTHVAVTEATLAYAQRNLVDASGITWLLEDVPHFVEHAIQRREHYDLILLDPPKFLRMADGHVWDIQRDFARLFKSLARLASPEFRGVWVSLHTRDVNPQSVASFLFQAFPGRRITIDELGLATADGRALPAAAAVHWEDEGRLAANTPLDAEAIEERLEVYLEAVLYSRRTAAEPARRLATLSRSEQDFVLRWVENIAPTNAEIAYQVAAHGAQALGAMDGAGVERWILHGLDCFDRAGLSPGVAALQDVAAFARGEQERLSGVIFEDVSGVLGLFVQGLSGRPLKLEGAERVYTDTEMLYLPPLLARFSERADNFRLYKIMAVFLWAQVRFGTFRLQGGRSLQTMLSAYADPGRAARLFHALETLRLNACIARELPGVHRELHALLARVGERLPALGWEAYAARLAQPTTSVADSHAMLEELYARAAPPPPALLFQGVLDAAAVESVQALRLARERDLLRTRLAELAEQSGSGDLAPAIDRPDAAAPRFTLEQLEEMPESDTVTLQLTLDGQRFNPPEDVRALFDSIRLDLGDIPDEYLVAAGAGGYRPAPERDPGLSAEDVWKGTYHEEGAFLYNEWDYKRNGYRKSWCVLRELDVTPQSLTFIRRTLNRYSGVVKELRRTFEALRGEDKLLKKQKYGDDIDLDALIEAYADTRSGLEMTDRLFMKKHKHERNMAVMFMVDMSGSTKGWINDAEREALVLLCEALETLGDRYAIYGFSGNTRKKCELFRIKRFDEPYSDEVRGRIAGVTPQEYTRMGVTIRHLSKLLNEVEARTKLLITLSDGKPDDFDGYRGDYGIEDTRQALIEAKQQGIHPFCITIDEEARDYLPHMYGAVNYTVINNVAKLPLKVSDIYRRLTT